MKYFHLKLEKIQPPRSKWCLFGSALGLTDGLYKQRAWVAKITGIDEQYGFKREFLKPDATDYAMANSRGTRGIYLNFCLPGDGSYYEISSPESWSSTDRYFLYGGNDGLEKVERSIVENSFRD